MSEETNIFSISALKTKYSRYACSLERLFKNNSLSCLQEKLRHPIYFKPKEEKIDDGLMHIKAMKLEKNKSSSVLTTVKMNQAQKNHNYNNEDKLKLIEISKTGIAKSKIIAAAENTESIIDKEMSFKEFIESQRQKK